MQPDYLFLSTWNEHIAQPQNQTIPPPISMGLESDITAANRAFVGAYLYTSNVQSKLCTRAESQREVLYLP